MHTKSSFFGVFFPALMPKPIKFVCIHSSVGVCVRIGMNLFYCIICYKCVLIRMCAMANNSNEIHWMLEGKSNFFLYFWLHRVFYTHFMRWGGYQNACCLCSMLNVLMAFLWNGIEETLLYCRYISYCLCIYCIQWIALLCRTRVLMQSVAHYMSVKIRADTRDWAKLIQHTMCEQTNGALNFI